MIEKLGSWELNKVHNVGCLAGLRDIPGNSVEIAVTSPPYWAQRGDQGIGASSDPRDYVAELVEVLLEVMRVLKPNGLLWLNMGDAYNTPINWRQEDYEYSSLGAEKMGLSANNSAYTKERGKRRAFVREDVPWLQYGNLLALPYRVVTNLCDHGMLFRGEVVWSKQKAMPEGVCRRPHRKHESIYIIAKSERHSFRRTPPVPSVWTLRVESNRTVHSSTFPVDLPITCIKASGMDAGTVLDPFMGSGTTGLAAKTLGFDYVGFELNEAFAKMANRRIDSESYNVAFDLNP